jgi:hypothetical protein
MAPLDLRVENLVLHSGPWGSATITESETTRLRCAFGEYAFELNAQLAPDRAASAVAAD